MKRIVVLGAAESGVGAAVLAQKQGCDVFVSDMGRIQPRYSRMLTDYGLPFEEGRHTPELILNADEIIKSPGIPETAPLVEAARQRGIPVVSEIEYAGRFTDARMVCITGSNGKTTTTSLIYHIFRKAGLNVGLAGNIGQSLALQVATAPHDWYVIELSSFQLDDMFRFRAHIAVLLNITPDHLDRYGYCMQNYVDAKMRILQNQQPADRFIYWADDDYVPAELARRAPGAERLAFSEVPQPGLAATIADDELRVERPVALRLPAERLSLPGRHNQRNALAAALACLSAGIAPDVVAEGLTDFPGVEHRLEKVGCYGGVYYVNDSKATNVDACRYALESVRTPIVLILGGKDKGNDYSAIRQLVAERCRALVYMGADNAKLHAAFDSLGLPVADTHSMAECLQACRRLACPGDTVLLSPCCASFDLFRNMEDRGEQFKAGVRAAAQ